MQDTTENLTQVQRLAQELKTLSVNVTENDRKEYMEENNCSKAKVSAYLNGKAYDADEAIKMLVFFRGKIEGREKIIQQQQTA